VRVKFELMDVLYNLSLNRFDHKWDCAAEQLSAPGCFRSASIRASRPSMWIWVLLFSVTRFVLAGFKR
jgi:hypothetical protein